MTTRTSEIERTSTGGYSPVTRRSRKALFFPTSRRSTQLYSLFRLLSWISLSQSYQLLPRCITGLRKPSLVTASTVQMPYRKRQLSMATTNVK